MNINFRPIKYIRSVIEQLTDVSVLHITSQNLKTHEIGIIITILNDIFSYDWCYDSNNNYLINIKHQIFIFRCKIDENNINDIKWYINDQIKTYFDVKPLFLSKRSDYLCNIKNVFDKEIEIDNKLINLENNINEINKYIKNIKHNETRECIICYNKINIPYAFVPCGHTNICNQCGSSFSKCPSCRNKIKTKIRIFI